MSDESPRRIRIYFANQSKLQRLVLPPNLRILSWRKQVEKMVAQYVMASTAQLPQIVPHDWLEVEDEAGNVYARFQNVLAFRDESILIEEAEWNQLDKTLDWKPSEQ